MVLASCNGAAPAGGDLKFVPVMNLVVPKFLLVRR
jgi:hypothetical protein